MISKLLPCMIVILFAPMCYGQKDIVIPKGFAEMTPPKVDSSKWRRLNFSRNEFEVKVTNGTLSVQKTNGRGRAELKIPGGTLFGYDMGEWGGELVFVASEDSAKPVKIKSGNVKFVFSYRNQIYFIEGLAHLGISNGAMYKLNIAKDNGFTYEKILDFEDAPEAFTIYNDKLLIATHNNFYVVTDLKKELVFKDTFWHSLYPNSIAVIDEKNVFVGMRGGIARLDLEKRTLRFYKY